MFLTALYTLLMLGASIWMGIRSRSMSLGRRFFIAFYLFLLGGVGVVLIQGESDFSLLMASCVNQLLTLAYLLASGIGATPSRLPTGIVLLKWTLLSVVIGASALVMSGLLLETFEALGGEVEQQGLVDLFTDGDPAEKLVTIVLVVGLAPVAEELLFRGTLLPWLCQKIGEWRGILTTGFLFGLMHFDTITAVPPLIIFGTVLSWWSRHTRWVLFPIIAHFCNNALVLLSI